MRATSKIQWYKVTNEDSTVPPKPLQKVATYNGDIFIAMEAFGLQRADVVTMMMELSGDALIGAQKAEGRESGIYVSVEMIRDGLTLTSPESIPEFDETIHNIRRIIQNGNHN